MHNQEDEEPVSVRPWTQRGLTYVDDPDTLVILQELEGNWDILELLGSEGWTLVVFGQSSSGEHLDKCDESKSITEIGL